MAHTRDRAVVRTLVWWARTSGVTLTPACVQAWKPLDTARAQHAGPLARPHAGQAGYTPGYMVRYMHATK